VFCGRWLHRWEVRSAGYTECPQIDYPDFNWL
jgi:hypothetical protein